MLLLGATAQFLVVLLLVATAQFLVGLTVDKVWTRWFATCSRTRPERLRGFQLVDERFVRE